MTPKRLSIDGAEIARRVRAQIAQEQFCAAPQASDERSTHGPTPTHLLTCSVDETAQPRNREKALSPSGDGIGGSSGCPYPLEARCLFLCCGFSSVVV